jgi:RimJ/RimL family protein N-acetyltransferase
MTYVEPILRDLPEQLETQRLVIRPPRAGDGVRFYAAIAESLEDLRRFPASMSWALCKQSVELSERYCREAHANFMTRRELPLLLLLPDGDTVIGCSGLYHCNWKVPRFEVGYWGRSSYQGRGLFTEGVGAIVDFAFNVLGARRVDALPDDENERSWRLCERLGFECEGLLRHERIAPDGTLRNTRIYARTR